MQNQERRDLTRRDILKGSLYVALGGGYFTSLGWRHALAEARATGKPLLIERELNARIPTPQNQQAYLAAIDFAKRDLWGYLNANFQLTSNQTAQLRTLSRDDLMRLNALLDRAKANNLRVAVRIMRRLDPETPSPNALYITPSPPPQPRGTLKEATDQGSCEKFGIWLTEG